MAATPKRALGQRGGAVTQQRVDADIERRAFGHGSQFLDAAFTEDEVRAAQARLRK